MLAFCCPLQGLQWIDSLIPKAIVLEITGPNPSKRQLLDSSIHHRGEAETVTPSQDLQGSQVDHWTSHECVFSSLPTVWARVVDKWPPPFHVSYRKTFFWTPLGPTDLCSSLLKNNSSGLKKKRALCWYFLLSVLNKTNYFFVSFLLERIRNISRVYMLACWRTQPSGWIRPWQGVSPQFEKSFPQASLLHSSLEKSCTQSHVCSSAIDYGSFSFSWQCQLRKHRAHSVSS